MAMWFGTGRRDGEERSQSPLGGLLMLLLAPMAAGLIRMAISRTREFSADATSARTLGNAQPAVYETGLKASARQAGHHSK
jgi:heat shock protein HtpX